MKYKMLIFIFCIGILVGITIFAPKTNTITGSATENCYVENQLCECGEKECVCGNKTVPADYFTNNRCGHP